MNIYVLCCVLSAMVSHEQATAVRALSKLNVSKNIQTRTGISCENRTTSENTNLPSPLTISANARQPEAEQIASQFPKNGPKTNIDAAVVLNIKYPSDIGNSYCISSNSFGFAQNHYMNSVYLYTLPSKFSFLPRMINGATKFPINAAAIDEENEYRKEPLYLADRKRYWPPPIFIIFISLLEIGVFMYDYTTVRNQKEFNTTRISSESLLIYRPDRRLQIWRFLTYMVLHANWFHLAFNVFIQVLYGSPLEMVHGPVRTAIIYIAGVLAGSLGTSVIDSEVYLVGASGGVYALLAAQLANVMINFGQMRYGISQLLAVLIFVFCDTGYAFYNKFVIEDSLDIIPSVSYIAHLAGSLAGFTIGLLVLTNFEHTTESNLIRWLAFGVYASFTLFAISFNLINTVIAQKLEEEGEVIKQHFFHDLGIS